MIFNSIVTALFYLLIAYTVIYGLLNLFRSNLSDIGQAKRLRELTRRPNARHLRRRPLVSAVIHAENDASTVEACLTSLIKNSYRKHEIIIVENASTDTTKRKILDFIKANPKSAIRLVAKRSRSSRSDALAAGAKWAKGEFVLIADASSVFEKAAIRSAAMRLVADPMPNALLLNVQVDHNYTLSGLANRFRAQMAVWAKKAGGFISPAYDSYNYAAIYRSKTLATILKPSQRSCLDDINDLSRLGISMAYDSQANLKSYKAVADPRLRLRGRLDTGRSLLAIAEPLVAGFMVFVALRFDNPGYIVLAWASFTALLLLSIWSDESHDWVAKIRVSLLALVAYSLYVGQSLWWLTRRLLSLASAGVVRSGSYRFRPS